MVSTPQLIMCYVTCPNDQVATQIAGALVSEKLAACCKIVPGVKSIYEWEGKIEESLEHLVIIKTQAHLFNKLSARVKALHPYDVPEVIASPIEHYEPTYGQWVID